MPILRQINIQGFKSVRDARLDLGLLNVFVGQNGSGKSNILEAIGMLSAAASGEINYKRLAERGVRLSAPEIFKSTFLNNRRKLTIGLCGTFSHEEHRLTYKVSLSPRREYESDIIRFHSESCKFNNKHIFKSRNPLRGDIYSDESALKTVMFDDYPSSLRNIIDALRNYAIYSPSTPILRGDSGDESHASPLGLSGGSLAQAVSYLIRNDSRWLDDFFDIFDWIGQIGTRNPSKTMQSQYVHTGNLVVYVKDTRMAKSFQDLHAYDVSEGVLYVLFVLALLAHPDSPEIFSIDNIDSSLNPGLATTVMSMISDHIQLEKKKQVIVTAHNAAVLDGVDLFNPEHRLFVVYRDKTGATSARLVTMPEGMSKEQWRESGMKLSEVWLSGAIGGISRPENF